MDFFRLSDQALPLQPSTSTILWRTMLLDAVAGVGQVLAGIEMIRMLREMLADCRRSWPDAGRSRC